MASHEHAARTEKAMRLADALTTAGASAADVPHLTAWDWATAEAAAGTRPASTATRSMVHGILLGREAERAAEADPFASFPKP